MNTPADNPCSLRPWALTAEAILDATEKPKLLISYRSVLARKLAATSDTFSKSTLQDRAEIQNESRKALVEMESLQRKLAELEGVRDRAAQRVNMARSRLAGI